MLNVTVNPLILPMFKKKGYWFDFDCCKTTFRNRENIPLFEIIYDQTTYLNILLTRKSEYRTGSINITCNGKGEPNLHFNIIENGKTKRMTININYDGQEERQ